MKRLGDFLQNKDLDNENVYQYPHSEETGNSGVDFVKHGNIVTHVNEIMLVSWRRRSTYEDFLRLMSMFKTSSVLRRRRLATGRAPGLSKPAPNVITVCLLEHLPQSRVTWKGRTVKQQVVRVIWHKAASPPHTDGSVVFARWRQKASPCSHPSRHPHRTGADPC